MPEVENQKLYEGTAIDSPSEVAPLSIDTPNSTSRRISRFCKALRIPMSWSTPLLHGYRGWR